MGLSSGPWSLASSGVWLWLALALIVLLGDLTLPTEAGPMIDTRPRREMLKRFAVRDTMKEPSLYDLLITALSEQEEVPAVQKPEYVIAGGDAGEKRDNFKPAKPCYWSLVSCYKKRKRNSISQSWQ